MQDAENEASLLKRARFRLGKVSCCLYQYTTDRNGNIATVDLQGSELVMNIFPKSFETKAMISLLGVYGSENPMIEV